MSLKRKWKVVLFIVSGLLAVLIIDSVSFRVIVRPVAMRKYEELTSGVKTWREVNRSMSFYDAVPPFLAGLGLGLLSMGFFKVVRQSIKNATLIIAIYYGVALIYFFIPVFVIQKSPGPVSFLGHVVTVNILPTFMGCLLSALLYSTLRGIKSAHRLS
jgi:predicted CDP-diglyceride synthetase/phosphatidate cytidylyltransferase